MRKYIIYAFICGASCAAVLVSGALGTFHPAAWFLAGFVLVTVINIIFKVRGM